jgi:SpoIID/LytB domain protein
VVLDAQGLLAAVVLVRAEELVAGTVPAESYANGPIEALKAQAIAARTELFSKLGRRHGDRPWLLTDEQEDQVYRGVGARHPRTDLATEATRGRLLFDTTKTQTGGNHPLAHAHYSAICGGHTEDNDATWNDPPSAVLRGHPDGRIPPPPRGDEKALRRWINARDAAPWCRVTTIGNNQKFHWKRKRTADQLTRLARRLRLGTFQRLEVIARGVSGRARSARLIGSKSSVILEPELAIRRAFGNLPSSLFVVDHQRGVGGTLTALNFTGRGWGHGVGMCQIGAIGMAEAGYNAQRILLHYYPGTKIERVY